MIHTTFFIYLLYIYIIGKCSNSKPACCCLFRRVFITFMDCPTGHVRFSWTVVFIRIENLLKASKTFTPVVIGGIITAIFLIFIILLIIILSMKYRKDKLQSQQAEFLHSKIYNDKFVEGKFKLFLLNDPK